MQGSMDEKFIPLTARSPCLLTGMHAGPRIAFDDLLIF